ncbi:hypothetical protein CHLNCDRAFT_145550 [Chlorella variabilis]|uniref:Uncharacterized protein n=1 Tax=Chlorella variabilis TaxID=554065 RepID=E1ZDR0_CHLVA|nr:hypothetical protein CHLNCDRAFT_145550 [Chlorella variabilis]EFN55903.1 hypothetical protein CHLNCDRAFT_145550 [Chlorella variabilis]|eukprot:XP_005848005.1 hypothetical protein CHLNCDRAFT_145550 [Chlorella variabilis]
MASKLERAFDELRQQHKVFVGAPAGCEWDGDITKTVQVQVLPSERAYLERLVEDAEDKYGGF